MIDSMPKRWLVQWRRSLSRKRELETRH